MPETIELTLDGSLTSVASGATGFELFQDKKVVAQRVNGELRDLAHILTSGDKVEAVLIDSPDGLSILRHSTAHVLAQAVQKINPDARLGIGRDGRAAGDVERACGCDLPGDGCRLIVGTELKRSGRGGGGQDRRPELRTRYDRADILHP